MYKFLTSVAESLVKKIIAANSDSCFFIKNLVLLLIIYKCEMLADFSSDKTNHSTMQSLLKNLAIKDKSSCQILSADFVIHYTNLIVKILDTLIGNAIKFSPPITEWIFAVPLLHFVMKECEPYRQLKGVSLDDPNK